MSRTCHRRSYAGAVPFLPPLPPPLADAVLAWLGVPAPRRDRDWLDALLQHYGQRVPWESASRIARAATRPASQRPHLPEAFWHGVLTQGTGGTCFESNAAMSALLATLGFDGAFTINDMADTRGCHTALVVTLESGRVVVDVGYPIYAALPLDAGATWRESPWFTYAIVPSGERRYRLENRPHPVPYLFDLIDVPVSPDDYVAALRRDYQPGGLFLDRVVVRKVVEGRVWRFTSHERPWHLQCFVDGTRVGHPMAQDVDAAARHLSRHFGIDAETMTTALAAVGTARGEA
jgi:arylamine N-acetyltransferase